MSALASVREWARREPWLFALFAALAFSSVLPLWVGRYVPLLDYPNHLSMVHVWFHIGDPKYRFGEFYETNLVPLPYWAQYASIYALSYVMPTEIAQKIFVTLSIGGLPASVAVLARQWGRDPRLCIFAFPLAWNFSMSNGFLSYTGALPVLFFALAALDRFGEKPSLGWGAIASLAGASLYFFHILAWLLFLVIGGCMVLFSPRRFSIRNAIIAGLPTLPAAGIGLWAYRAAKTMKVPFNPYNAQGLSGFHGVYNDLSSNLGGVLGWLMNMFPGASDEAAMLVLCAMWLLLYASRPIAGATDRPEQDDFSLRTWRVEIAAAVSVVILFELPRSLLQPFYWYAISYRVAVVSALLLALSVRGPVAGARRVLLAIAGIAGVFFCLGVAAHFYRFNQRARGFDDVMSVVPPGKQVLPIMLKLGDPEVNVNCFNQWGTWVQQRQGGYILFNFVGEFPIRYKKKLPTPPWDHPEMFNFKQHSEGWDYFVVHGPSTVRPFAGFEDRVQLLKRSGDWEIWQKLLPPK